MAFCSECNREIAKTAISCPHCGNRFETPEPPRALLDRLRKSFWLCLLIVLPPTLFHLWWPDFYQDITFKPYRDYLDQTPPELSPGGTWFNSTEPLSLQSLRGKVVWLEFSFDRCGGCRAMTPTLEEWHKQYAGAGLVIVDIYNGKADKLYYPDPLANLQRKLAQHPVSFPVLYEDDGETSIRYGIQGCPSGYLIDRSGRVVWQDAPHGNQARVERKIKAALAK